MAKPTTKGRPRPRARPTSRGRRPQRRPQSPWYRRPQMRMLLVIGVVVIAGAAVLLLMSGQGRPQQSSKPEPVVGPDLHSLVIDPTDPDRVWIGSHQGASVSNDGGETWRVVPSLDGADAMGWAFMGDSIFVGGHPGLSVSTDGGRTFEQRNEGLPSTDVHALGAGKSVIYAASPAVGVFASTDGGTTWEMRTEQVGQGFMGSILVDPSDEDHLLSPDMRAGAAESTDGGRSWTALGGVQGATWVTWDPEDTDHIIATHPDAAAETTDGGRSWEPLDIPDGASIVGMDPSEPRVLYAAVHEEPTAVVWISRNGGQTWARP